MFLPLASIFSPKQPEASPRWPKVAPRDPGRAKMSVVLKSGIGFRVVVGAQGTQSPDRGPDPVSPSALPLQLMAVAFLKRPSRRARLPSFFTMLEWFQGLKGLTN